jgi:membrane protein CcdC involved in cytochrome C biogenesis
MPHGAILVLIGVLFIFSMYRRVKRTIGFQKLAKRRMIIRIVLFAIICVLFLITGYTNPTIYIFDVLGILLGGVIAYFAIRSTSFEWRKNAWYYRPNPWIGAILIVLFIGRIVYRLYQDYALIGNAAAKGAGSQLAQQNQLATYSHDPSTTIILFVLISYYLVYYTFVIGRERHLEADAARTGENGLG